MTAHSRGVTKRLLERLLSAQELRAARERRASFARKLRMADRLMAEGRPKVEDVK